MHALWAQPLDPLHSTTLSALVAAIPLVIVLVVMGGLRKSGLAASAWGLAAAGALAVAVWRMPIDLAVASTAFGVAYALYPILYVVFGALCLYNLTREAGAFDLLRRWMEQHASGDACVQAILVAFCFGALLESCAGFGAPVAVTAFLLTGLGVPAFRAVLVALVANTAPVAFGSMGIPVVALAGVTGLDLMQLSAMVGRQVPLLSLVVPLYLAWIVGGGAGLRRSWPAALVAGVSFATAQGAGREPVGPVRGRHHRVARVDRGDWSRLLRVWSPAAVEQDSSRAPRVPRRIHVPDRPRLVRRLVPVGAALAGHRGVVVLQGHGDRRGGDARAEAAQRRADHALPEAVRGASTRCSPSRRAPASCWSRWSRRSPCA